MAYGRIAAVGKCTPSIGSFSNETVILTDDNILCFTGDLDSVTTTGQRALFQLPNVIPYPSGVINFEACYLEGGTFKSGYFYINTSGVVGIRHAVTSAKIWFNGICVNLNNNFYNSTIGNNDMSAMTSPINAR